MTQLQMFGFLILAPTIAYCSLLNIDAIILRPDIYNTIYHIKQVYKFVQRCKNLYRNGPWAPIWLTQNARRKSFFWIIHEFLIPIKRYLNGNMFFWKDVHLFLNILPFCARQNCCIPEKLYFEINKKVVVSSSIL